jgi:PTH1 family peptidyl-tRNA hydrolase
MKQAALIGLGNPGSQYADTRHNIGFWAVDAIASRLSLSSKDFQLKHHAHFLKTEIHIHMAGEEHDCTLFLMKPETYMNLSGKSVQSLMTMFKLHPEDLYVIHDDLDLEPGKIRIKKGGGSGGHNGLKSIDETIGPNYWRIRLGIGRSENPHIPTERYVLQRPSNEDATAIQDTINGLSENITMLFTNQADKLMNKIAVQKQKQSTSSAPR